MTRTVRLALAALVGALALGAVGGTASAVPPAAVQQPAAVRAAAPTDPPASIRLAHLAPTTPPMDVYATPFNGRQTALLTDVGYGAVSTYIPTTPGPYVFAFRPAGSSATSPALLTMSAVLKSGSAYTVAGIGQDANVKSILIPDDLTPPPAGQARVRFINADSTAGSVDLTISGGAALVQQAGFASVTGYAAVPAGPWSLDVKTGKAPQGTTMELDLAAGSVNTLLLLRSDSPVGDLTSVIDSAGMTRVGDGSVMAPIADARGAAAPAVGGIATGGGGTASATTGPRLQLWSGPTDRLSR